MKFFGVDNELSSQARNWVLTFLSAWPLWVILFVVVGVLLLVITLYRREKPGLPLRDVVIFTALRSLALVILLAMIWQPAVIWEIPQEREATLLLVLDDSQSMSVPDRYDGSAELVHVVRALWPQEMKDFGGTQVAELPADRRAELGSLTRAGLVPPRDVGNMDVADGVQVVRQRTNQVPLHHLHMVDIVQQADIGAVDLTHQLQPGTRMIEPIAFVIDERVERFHVERDPRLLGQRRQCLESFQHTLSLCRFGQVGELMGNDAIGPQLIRKKEESLHAHLPGLVQRLLYTSHKRDPLVWVNERAAQVGLE